MTDAPIPVPGRDEVLVEVGACGMNNTDVNTRMGWYSKSVSRATGEETAATDVDGSWTGAVTFPRIQGADPVGRIAEVGPSVDPDRVGERVMIDAWMRDPHGDLARAGYLGLRAGRWLRRVRHRARCQCPPGTQRPDRRRTGRFPVLVLDRRAHAGASRCWGAGLRAGHRCLWRGGKRPDPAGAPAGGPPPSVSHPGPRRRPSRRRPERIMCSTGGLHLCPPRSSTRAEAGWTSWPTW